LFDRNHEALEIFLRYVTAPTEALSYSGVDEAWLKHEAMDEVLYRLHDFVTAALSLVDHTRVIHGQLYGPTDLMPDYQIEIDRRFKDDPRTQFVLGLRQMCQHYRLPSLNHQFEAKSIGPGGRAKFRISLALRKEDLRSFSKWNAHAKAFLRNAPDRIELLELVNAYHRHVSDFNQWFATRQQEIHRLSPERYERMLKHGETYLDRKEVGEVERNIQELEERAGAPLTFADLLDALKPMLTILDHARLRFCQHDPDLWMRTALRSVERTFLIPAPLRERLLALVTGPQQDA
jgi:hypothetical protein